MIYNKRYRKRKRKCQNRILEVLKLMEPPVVMKKKKIHKMTSGKKILKTIPERSKYL